MWLDIEVLTPVHVGTGEFLSPLEYAVNGQQVGVVDLGRLFRRDPARAEAIGEGLATASLAKLRTMTLNGLLTWQELEDEELWRYRLSGSEATIAELAGASERDHELRLASKTPDGRAYLPGTAIKGAIRTALICAWSAANPEWARRLLKQPNPGVANEEVQRPLYGEGVRQDPNHDLLRVLMIGDTCGVHPSEALQLVQERVLSARILGDRTRGEGNDEYKAFLVFLECLKPKSSLMASARILGDLSDVRKTQILGWTNRQRALTPQVLCAAANQMSAEVCAWELEYFNLVQGKDCREVIQFYRDLRGRLESPADNIAYLCLGRGAGWHKLTPGILVARHLSGTDFTEFRKKFGLAAVDDERLRQKESLRRFDRRDFVFPKSRKVVAEHDRSVAPLGWVRLEFKEGELPRPLSAPFPTRVMLPSRPEVPVSQEEPPQVPQAPPAQRCNPHVEEAERLVRTLKAHEVKGRLQAIAAEIGKSPIEERERLIELFRSRQGELQLKAKDIRASMETLARLLKPAPQAGEE